ncbi:MAG: ABC transporter permease [Deltaproteobacteria bacterium]|jgi:simple sugar transport system permease protein|nr:ABC transporter permease [Deltaproteobacteria bacterium]
MASGISIDFVSFAFATIRVMTPLLFASMACLVYTKGGIDSIATEGIMLMCAMAGAAGAWLLGGPFQGLLFGMATGVALSFLFGYATLSLKANPVLAGIALNILAGGLTIFVIYYLTGEKGSTQSLSSGTLPNVRVPLLADVPVLGRILSGHNVLTYVSLLTVAALHFFLYKTRSGLRLRAAGENPQAAESVGLSVTRCKYLALFIAGALAGLGGAFMSLGYVSFFSKNMTAGRGFIGMAAESMGHGVPGGVLLATLLFSVSDALSVQLQMMSLPPELMQLMPYLVTIVAIAVYSRHRARRRAAGPAADPKEVKP